MDLFQMRSVITISWVRENSHCETPSKDHAVNRASSTQYGKLLMHIELMDIGV
jgi:hypothetical protein